MRFQQSSDSVARSLSFSMMILISRSLIPATCPWRSLFSSNERNLQQVDLSGPGRDTKSLDFFLRSDLTSRLREVHPCYENKIWSISFLKSTYFDRSSCLRSRGLFNAKRSAHGLLPP